jgi:hypothetical protein
MELQFHPDQPVTLTILNADSSKATAAVSRIVSISGRRVRVSCDISVPSATPVQLEWAGNVILADVRGRQQPDNLLLLDVHHVLAAGEMRQMRELWT